MYFFSYAYLPFFLGAALLAYYLTPLRKRWVALLVFSLIFYIANAKELFFFLFISSLIVYLAALWLGRIQSCSSAVLRMSSPEEKKRFRADFTIQEKAVVFLALAGSFGILAAVKYSGFAAGQLNLLFRRLSLGSRLSVPPMLLPLGISYYTLQATGYLVDVYRGKVKANGNYAQVLLFLCFFPQIVEGPIGRYDRLEPQLCEGHRFDYRDFTYGAQRILWGLLKEIVIADRAGILVDQVFNHYGQYSGGGVALAVLLYTLQLYADFSGFIDVASGSAQMFGIRLDPNFRRPFFSATVSEFWRRWHITLGAWMRDYIFYPVSLSGAVTGLSLAARRANRKTLSRWISAAVPLLCVWLMMGIWHGAGWKYLAYGMYYFALILLGILCGPAAARLPLNRRCAPYRLFQVLRTFLLVNIGMLIFRARNLRAAAHMFLSVFRPSATFTNGALLRLGFTWKDLAVLAAGALVLLLVGCLQEKGVSLRESVGKWPLPLRWGVYLSAMFVLILFGAYGTAYTPVDLIYAKF